MHGKDTATAECSGCHTPGAALRHPQLTLPALPLNGRADSPVSFLLCRSSTWKPTRGDLHTLTLHSHKHLHRRFQQDREPSACPLTYLALGSLTKGHFGVSYSLAGAPWCFQPAHTHTSHCSHWCSGSRGCLESLHESPACLKSLPGSMPYLLATPLKLSQPITPL